MISDHCMAPADGQFATLERMLEALDSAGIHVLMWGCMRDYSSGVSDMPALVVANRPVAAKALHRAGWGFDAGQKGWSYRGQFGPRDR